MRTGVAADAGASSGAGGSAPSGSGGGGDASAGAGATTGATYSLSEYVGPEVWTSLLRVSAVDASDRLYLTNGQDVFSVADGVPAVHLTFAEVKAATGLPPGGALDLAEILDLDVGPDGRLYVLVHAIPDLVLVSEAPHQASRAYPEMELQAFASYYIGVESADRVLVITSKGLYEAAAPAPVQVYDEAQLAADGVACTGHDFAVSQHGRMYYLPCNEVAGVVAGPTDGAGVGILAKPSDLDEEYGWRFVAVARDPSGGVVVPMTGTVYHFDDDGTPTEVSMSPTLEEAAAEAGGSRLFNFASAAVGPTGTIYLTVGTTVYRAVRERQ